jgi:glycosyltransferase involved in cell wall biosynthesis
MRNIHIIHVVESNKRHEWLENLLSLLNAREFSQTFISVEPAGEISAYLLERFPSIHVNRAREHRLNIFTGVQEVIKSKDKNSLNVVFALGHPAAIITGIASCFVRTNFVFSHMHQPHYFDYMEPKWKSVLHSSLYRFYLRRATIIHSLSLEVLKNLNKYHVEAERILSVYIGVDFRKINRQLRERKITIGPPGNFPKVLMVGRLSPEKNYERALHAFAQFLKTRPQALLLIAGQGPLEKKLVNLAKQLNISSHVHFLGYIENIPAIMSEVDVLLHLATTESYGQVYIEAVLSGLPIVCTPTGVALDLMEDEVADIHVCRNDSAQEINDVLEYCLSNVQDSSIDQAARFAKYYEHDENYVHEQIANSFVKFLKARD